MKILMQARSNLFTLKGGDTIQILKTKEYLEKLGIEIDISTELEPKLNKYDLVHLFNLTRIQETYFQMKNAKNQNKKVIFSPIYWPSNEFEKKGQVGMRKIVNKVLSINQIESLKAFFKYYFKDEKNLGTKYLIKNNFSNMQIEILNNADWFLPNSKLEMEEIKKYLGFESKNFTVVPNAIDKNAFTNLSNSVSDEKIFEKYKGYILCVGRIETRKNQLRLLNALKNTNYRILLVGKISPGHKKYGLKVLDLIKSNKNFDYIEEMQNNDLYKLYKQCKVHVLPSWFETPGLVSLEAAIMGCNIVVSNRGTTKDYFNKFAYFCEPNDENSIVKAINEAYKSDYNEDFKKYILANYIWEKAAERTAEGYNNMLTKRID